jgi:hypothetical protein
MNTTGRGCFRSGDLRQGICQRQGSAVMVRNWALKRRARDLPGGRLGSEPLPRQSGVVGYTSCRPDSEGKDFCAGARGGRELSASQS